MASATLPEQRVILKSVSWESYERLLTEHQDPSSTRFHYHRGELEIMVLSPRHEWICQVIAQLIDVVAIEMDIDSFGFGSTTFKRKDLDCGFEPDACYYITRESQVRGKDDLDLETDPPPDLVVEIDITHPSLNKLPIYAAVGVPEVWRFDGSSVSILRLESGRYLAAAKSSFFPGVTGEIVAGFIESAKSMPRTAWVKQVRKWAATA